MARHLRRRAADTVAPYLQRTAFVRGLPAVARIRMAARTIRRWGSGFLMEARNQARGVVPQDGRARENQPMPRTASTGRAGKPPGAAFDWQFSFRWVGRSKLSSLTDARISQRQ